MIALVNVEVRRALARRSFRVVAAILLLGIVVGSLITFLVSRDEVATQPGFEQVREHAFDACMRGEFEWPFALPSGMSREEFCSQATPSQGWTSDKRFHLVHLLDIFEGLTGPLVLIAWGVGASFVGAEWHHGTITTSLTWEPRRDRLLAAKYAAIAIIVFVTVLVFFALLSAALLPSAIWHGTTAGTGSAWARSLAGTALRSGALAVMTASVGFGLASLTRNTGAALGVGFVYLLAVENLIRGLKPAWQRWLLGDNAVAFVSGEPQGYAFGYTPSVTRAGVVLGAYCAVLLAVAFGQFRARDVT